MSSTRSTAPLYEAGSATRLLLRTGGHPPLTHLMREAARVGAEHAGRDAGEEDAVRRQRGGERGGKVAEPRPPPLPRADAAPTTPSAKEEWGAGC